jgi:two-component system sensor histidine kinase BaeS
VAVLEEAIETFRERYDAAKLRLDSSRLVDEGWWLRGDAGRLSQVFGNLLENSLRYTQAGGQLRIGARTSKQQLLLEFDDSAPGAHPPPPCHACSSASSALNPRAAGLSAARAWAWRSAGLWSKRTAARSALPASALGGLRICIDLPLEKP